MNSNQYWSSFSISSICFSLLEFSLHKILHNKMKEQAAPLSFKLGTTKSWKTWNSSWPPKSQSEIFKLSFTNIGSTSIPIVRMGLLKKHLNFCKDCLKGDFKENFQLLWNVVFLVVECWNHHDSRIVWSQKIGICYVFLKSLSAYTN